MVQYNFFLNICKNGWFSFCLSHTRYLCYFFFSFQRSNVSHSASVVADKFTISTFYVWPLTWNGTLLVSSVKNAGNFWMRVARVLCAMEKRTANVTTHDSSAPNVINAVVHLVKMILWCELKPKFIILSASGVLRVRGS